VNVNSERDLAFTFAICCRPSVCLSSVVGNARAPYLAVVISRNIYTAFATFAIRWHPWKIVRISSQGNPSVGRVKHNRGSKI